MPVKFILDPERFGGKELAQIYRLFCEAYEIEILDDDDFSVFGGDIIGTLGMEHLRESSFGLDWRPYMGAKFFGRMRGNHFEFHGYTEDESRSEEHDAEFQKRVREYLEGKAEFC